MRGTVPTPLQKKAEARNQIAGFIEAHLSPASCGEEPSSLFQTFTFWMANILSSLLATSEVLIF